ncbi:hypothetical protein PMIN06_010859 [Paraphaeosphaeria minitans]
MRDDRQGSPIIALHWFSPSRSSGGCEDHPLGHWAKERISPVAPKSWQGTAAQGKRATHSDPTSAPSTINTPERDVSWPLDGTASWMLGKARPGVKCRARAACEMQRRVQCSACVASRQLSPNAAAAGDSA